MAINQSQHETGTEFRPAILGLMEQLLHHLCFLWWRLTRQMFRDRRTEPSSIIPTK